MIVNIHKLRIVSISKAVIHATFATVALVAHGANKELQLSKMASSSDFYPYWMANMAPAFKNLTLLDLSLPGNDATATPFRI